MRIKNIWNFAAIISVALMLSAIGCDGETSLRNEKGGEKISSKSTRLAQTKINPPFILDFGYDTDSEGKIIRVKADVTPTRDLENLAVEWTVPDSVEISRETRRTEIVPENIRRGVVGKYEIAIGKYDRTESRTVSVTVKVLWRGKWYGTARALDLNAPSETTRGGGKTRRYTDAPMRLMKD